MVHKLITPRRIAPFVLGGASSIHILRRMWQLSCMPASKMQLHHFLLKQTDVVLVVSSSPVVIWYLAGRNNHRPGPDSSANASTLEMLVVRTAHQLRQVFTSLLLGLGLMERKATTGQVAEVPQLANRLMNVVSKGVEAVNTLDPPASLDLGERARKV